MVRSVCTDDGGRDEGVTAVGAAKRAKSSRSFAAHNGRNVNSSTHS